MAALREENVYMQKESAINHAVPLGVSDLLHACHTPVTSV